MMAVPRLAKNEQDRFYEKIDAVIKMRRLLGCLGVLGVLYGCTPEPPHIIESSRIFRNFNKLAVNDGLVPFGIGGAFFSDIEEFSLDYNLYLDSISVDEARRIIVGKAEELYALVNVPSARQYLRYNPYDENHGYLAITFFDKIGEKFPEGTVTSVSVAKGKVIFSEYRNVSYENLFSEPYAEAYEKVYGVPLPDRREQFGLE